MIDSNKYRVPYAFDRVADTTWNDYLERIRQAARLIALRREFINNEALTFPSSLPEYRPEYLGESIAIAMLAALKRQTIEKEEWLYARPHVRTLIAKVLGWPGGERVRATALTVAKHRLGIPFERHATSADALAEVAVDLDAEKVKFDVSEPTAIQLRVGSRTAGLFFLTGMEASTRIPPEDCLLNQVEDLPLIDALRLFAYDGPLWAAGFEYAVTGLRRVRIDDITTCLRREVKVALFAGVRAALKRRLCINTINDKPLQSNAIDTPIAILMYHRVSDEGDPALSRYRVTTEQFKNQMEWLKSNGFEPLSLDALEGAYRGRRQLPRRPVLISFDDGYRDFYDHAWPVLTTLAFPSVMFVVAGKVGRFSDWDRDIGRSEPLMDWRQLREISAHGVSIGSHSITHRRFSRLNIKEAYHEMQQSALIIERSLGRRPSAFCYPYGVYDRLIERLLPICGYEFAFTCDEAGASMRGNPFRLPRIEVMGSDDLHRFAEKLMAHTA